MTNREYMIAVLQEELDDYGAIDAAIYYGINCPYYEGDSRAHCNKSEITRVLCTACKTEWLDMKVDE